MEKEFADNLIMQERALVQRTYEEQKTKLDKAKELGIITATEMDQKIAVLLA